MMGDMTPKVTGIEGIFLFDRKNLWKQGKVRKKTRDSPSIDYGYAFEFTDANRPGEINDIRWRPFKDGTDYFKPSEKEIMINYRVQNPEGSVKKLRENGVTILDNI